MKFRSHQLDDPGTFQTVRHSFHEIGHWLVAKEFGYRITTVRVDRCGGLTTGNWNTPCLERMAATVAGYLTEAAFLRAWCTGLPQNLHKTLRKSRAARDDMTLLDKDIRACGHTRHDAEKLALPIIHTKWDLIERRAHTLATKGKLPWQDR